MKCFQRSAFLLYFVIAGFACFMSPGSSYAQTLPVCSHQYYDADNDGFGWQDEASCIVTAETIPPPVHINEQTGGQVDLTRVYWDGNTDIANRTIQCDQYSFDSINGIYSLVDDGTINTVYYRHSQLPSVSPFEGWMRLSLNSDFDTGWQIYNPPLWTLSDGRYIGPGLLADAYAELVVSGGKKVVRRWYDEGEILYFLGYDYLENFSGFWDSLRMESGGYIECSDTSGADFTPTGQTGQPTTNPGSATPAAIILSAEIDPENSGQVPAMPDDIYNLITGEKVQLTRAYWDLNADIAGEFSCSGLTFAQTATPNYIPFGARSTSYKWHPTYSLSATSADYWTRTEGHGGSRWVNFENGFFKNEVPEIFEFHYVEIVAQPDGRKLSRGWRSSEYYVECSIVPTGALPQVQTNDISMPDTATIDSTSEMSPVVIDNESTNSSEVRPEDSQILTTDSGVPDTATIDNTNDTSPVVTGNESTNSSDVQPENSQINSGGGGLMGPWFLFVFLNLYCLRLGLSGRRTCTFNILRTPVRCTEYRFQGN